MMRDTVVALAFVVGIAIINCVWWLVIKSTNRLSCSLFGKNSNMSIQTFSDAPLGKTASDAIGCCHTYGFVRRSGKHAQYRNRRWPWGTTITSFSWSCTFDARHNDWPSGNCARSKENRSGERQAWLSVIRRLKRRLKPGPRCYRRWNECSVFRRTWTEICRQPSWTARKWNHLISVFLSFHSSWCLPSCRYLV